MNLNRKETKFMKPKIKVIDSIMGAGKTSYAIQMMVERTDVNFLYITPFLDEVDRICKECSSRGFVQPEKSKQNNKSEDLKRLLAEGRSIAATHELFKRIDEEALELIRADNYVLILDEVMQVLEPLESKEDKVDGLIEREVIELEHESERIARVRPGKESRLDEYDDLRIYAETGRLICVDRCILMWLFPAHTFESFDEVWNLCYLFEGSLQLAYYKMHDLDYEFHSVEFEGEKYRLVSYDPNHDLKVRKELGRLINVYDGKLNRIGETRANRNPFSKNWLKKSRYAHGKIRNHLYNYFRNVVQGSSKDNMWTTFKNFKSALSGNGYGKGFVGLTVRATNQYRHKINLAYLANIFFKPEVERYFQVKDIPLDVDLYALNELIQWIFRSRIRNFQHEPKDRTINLYLPAERMRKFLYAWLDSSEKKLAEQTC